MQELREVIVVGAIVVSIFLAARGEFKRCWECGSWFLGRAFDHKLGHELS